jgi:hypothetical protein
LALSGTPLSTTTQHINLPASGTAAVGWSVRADEVTEAQLRFDLFMETADETAWHDAVVMPLVVLPRAVPQVTTVSGEVGEEWIVTIAPDDGAIPDLTRWELSLAPSIATGMLDGLEYLIDYPFG